MAALLRVAGVNAGLAESNGSLTCRLTAKSRDQLRYPTLGNRVSGYFCLFYRDRIFGDGEFALCVGYGCLGSVQFRRDASAIVERQLHGAYPAGRQYSVAQSGGAWVRLLDDVVDTDYSGAYRQSHTTPPPMTPPFRCHHVLVLRRRQ